MEKRGNLTNVSSHTRVSSASKKCFYYYSVYPLSYLACDKGFIPPRSGRPTVSDHISIHVSKSVLPF